MAAAAVADDDHTCAANRPCANHACCGSTGVCGYGPDYCGKGCQSNCDAKAECGKYAAEPGKKCPLNVCCSEFGFCGTVQDFCNDKCQNNCVLHPEPPKHDKGDVLTRVIGYYEGWSARSKCHETKPEDLPLDALTHINFAFAFIDPDTYDLTPMTDGKTLNTLFAQTTALKVANPNLKVFISVGGWTFSNNGTMTQPLLGKISSSGPKRRAFAAKVVDFLYKNNFDGIDLDWEYPGAPDRGGDPDDTDSMVKLFEDLRAAVNNSGKDYQLSFTIPASYWYLRWFDVPALLKYADWTNLMSYDIHGLWDRDSAIGNIVQPHTNLTEIQTAAEVPPGKVNLGLGFYGRSFTLSDPACRKPGCRFRDASRPGPCTNTGGFLAYYEIVDILEKNKDIKLQHDEDAAVKDFSWDSDQWISFDDKDTFAQKVKWANDVGMAGILIWASDLDDYKFSAHAGLLGKDIKPNKEFIPTVNVAHTRLNGVDLSTINYDQACHLVDTCIDPDIVRCDTLVSGTVFVGSDKSNCGKGPYVKPICCRREVAPKTCQWRGGGADCNGQCHAKEVTLFYSRYGGGPKSESGTKKCNRGDKVFCCEDERFSSLTDSCAWTKCGVTKCKDDEVDVAYATNINSNCGVFDGTGMKYCCKGKVAPLKNCHWVGKGDCADNTCDNKETTLLTDLRGGGGGGYACNWGRSPTLCCTPNLDILTPATCDVPLTDSSLGLGFRTGLDPDADYDEELPPCDPDAGSCADPVNTRSDLWLPGSLLEHHVVDKRGEKRKYEVKLWSPIQQAYIIYIIVSRAYPGITWIDKKFRGNPPCHKAYKQGGNSCDNTEMIEIDLSSITRPERLGSTAQGTGPGFDTEHNPDLQYVRDLLHYASIGAFLNGDSASVTVNGDSINRDWNAAVPKGTFPRTGKGAQYLTTPSEYFFEQFGSNTNRQPLIAADRSINQMKGRVFDITSSPQDESDFTRNLRHLVSTAQGEAELFAPIRGVIRVFEYMNYDTSRAVIQANRQSLRDATQRIEAAVPSLAGLARFHAEFDNNWYQTLSSRAYDWVYTHLAEIRDAMRLPAIANTPVATRVNAILDALFRKMLAIRPPPDI